MGGYPESWAAVAFPASSLKSAIVTYALRLRLAGMA